MDIGLLTSLLPAPTHRVNKHEDRTIHVASCTLQELFLGNIPLAEGKGSVHGTLAIPEYQRPYVWREKQLNRLLKDLVEYKRNAQANNPLYYLGSIIIHQDGEQLKIIDGQQRITTLLILQSVVRPGRLAPVVYRSPVSIQSIRHNHRYLQAVFDRKIADFQGISKEDIVDFSQINVTLVITDSEDLAYTFFETQNTGGVRLSGSDIAKAHHLRAIPSKKMVAHQAKTWERSSPEKVESCIKNLIKIRYWKNRSWVPFPFYRNERSIKEVIIEEFTEGTLHQNQDIAFYYSVLKKENGRAYQVNQSPYRQVRQPLYDGNNFMDYVHEYVELHQILFERKDHPRVSDAFYEFRADLLHGEDGTLFLKELTEIALVTYVSRFGFERLLEFALWVYRYVYSLRVSTMRNVREDSIFKFVYDYALIDTILEAYTIDELIVHLKKYRYLFSAENLEDHQSKGKHLLRVKTYFGNYGIEQFTSASQMQRDNLFDKVLITAIQERLKKSDAND